MQNPGQTRIFYKPDQTRLTWTKHDSVDQDNLDDPTRFQPCPLADPGIHRDHMNISRVEYRLDTDLPFCHLSMTVVHDTT